MDDSLKTAIKNEFDDFKTHLGSYATKEDVENKLKFIQEQVEKQKPNDLGKSFEYSKNTENMQKSIDEVYEALEKQSDAIKSIQETKAVSKSLPELISEKMDAIKSIVKSGAGRVNLTVDKTLVTRPAVANSTLAQRLTDVGQEASQLNVIRSLYPTGIVGANSNGVIRYVDQLVNTRNADWTAEGAVKPESAITWQEYTLPIQKIADTIPVSMEMISDVDFVSSELNNLLIKNLALKIDNDLYNGSGVSPIIFGAYTRADTFTAVASGIVDANIFDLVVKVQEDITSGTSYAPNYAVMNHATYNAMVLKKDGNNNYVRPPFVTSANAIINVNGIQIVISNSVTANTMLVGDFSRSTLYSIGGLSIDFGFIDKQFVENTITLRAEERLGMLIRTAHTDAFRKVEDIDAALLTLSI